MRLRTEYVLTGRPVAVTPVGLLADLRSMVREIRKASSAGLMAESLWFWTKCIARSLWHREYWYGFIAHFDDYAEGGRPTPIPGHGWVHSRAILSLAHQAITSRTVRDYAGHYRRISGRGRIKWYCYGCERYRYRWKEVR